MVLSAPAALRMAAGVLLLLAFLPPAQAQAPDPLGAQSSALGVVVVCPQTFLAVDYAKDQTVECSVQDLSKDSVVAPGSTSGTSVSSHSLRLAAVPRNESVLGYQVLLSRDFISMYGGDVHTFTVNVKATPQLNSQEFEFDLHAVYEGPNGYRSNQTIPFTAEVNFYDFAVVSMNNQVQDAGQDHIVRYEVVVQNVGVYPDTYRFTVKTDPDVKVSVPPNLYVPPGETRTAVVSVLTPHGKLYEVGRSIPVSVKVNSAEGTGAYSAYGVLKVRGPYVPVYWIPLLLVGLVSAGVVARGARERGELRRLEKGRPRRVEPTPRQAALLAELKRRDPDAYRGKRAALAAVYRERRSEYDEHRKEMEARDREEAKQARREFKEAKKRRKQQLKEQRLAAKRQKRLDRVEAKKERKLRNAKEKELAKRRKKLDKAKARLEKRQAKLDRKQAKKDAKEQARAEKLARKQARAEARAAKKRGP